MSRGPLLVGTEWLASNLGRHGLVVVDLRWREDGSGRTRYEAGHVPGAVYLDWSVDIVDPDHEVAFMLAPPDAFAAAMERIGVGDEDTVVAYADQRGSGPFRLWWACRRYGHEQVRVLDGGFGKWKSEGRPVTTASPSPRSVRWRPGPGPSMLATADEILRAESDPSIKVLDSRPPAQFEGRAVWFETGPVDADSDGIAHTARGDIRAGRVPWAVSVPYFELYRADDTMKSPEELRQVLATAKVAPGSTCITYCGVGISASALLFALTLAGVEDVRLYDGSWEEWGRDPARPVARG